MVPKADLKPGDMLQGGYSSNYTERRSPWIYFSETVFAATWGAELAKGEGPGSNRRGRSWMIRM
jgi:rifampin ADP-ribosylating transferase